MSISYEDGEELQLWYIIYVLYVYARLYFIFYCIAPLLLRVISTALLSCLSTSVSTPSPLPRGAKSISAFPATSLRYSSCQC